ncbi:MAG: c-type cytochrome [Planctomycetes bacterium]|nr:c-type cytochrome [Planctomycetota bacterium]
MRYPLLPLVATFAAVVTTCASPPTTAERAAIAAGRGAALYQRHCAACHGPDGDGDTAVAHFLLPRPNAFRDGLFKLVSTTNGVPSEDDLVATLRRGMPGSTMMSWGWMPEADLRLLAREVRRLAVRGRAESIAATAKLAGQPLAPDQALAQAEQQLLPGPDVDGNVTVPSGADAAAAGARLWNTHCASCHGEDGRGLPGHEGLPTDGTWLWPRDLSAGWMRGGASLRELAFRIRAGMPAAHMPPSRLSAAETALLANHVRSLISEPTADHHVQWRRTVRAVRVARLPDDGDAAAWAKVEPVRLPLAPLWWRNDAAFEANLRVVHDGRTIAMQWSWADATRTDRPQPGMAMGDGLAVQFAQVQDPPMFAMGSEREPVNVWRWHAYDPKATAGMVDLMAMRHSGLDVPVDVRPPASAESIELGGAGSAPSATGSGLPLHVAREWTDGRWTATFRRDLAARNAHEVDLAVGTPVLFAVAVWDGAHDKHAASKAITTWHVLALQ